MVPAAVVVGRVSVTPLGTESDYNGVAVSGIVPIARLLPLNT